MLITSTKPKTATRYQKSDKSPNLKDPKSTVLNTVRDTVDTASEKVENTPILANTLSAGASLARSFKSFPGFVYPSVYGATGVEQQQIYQGLDRLPLHHVNDIKAIEVVPEIHNNKPGFVTNGRAWDFHATNHVELSRKELHNPNKWFRTQTHEAGHAVDYETQMFKLFGERSSKNPFGKGPYISDYATTNPKEDFAESYEEFFVDPENLKAKAPEKYEAIKELAEPTWMERLVDRKEFRETGKYMADVIGPSKPARHGIQTAFYASSLLQIGHGVSQWVRSKESNDPMTHSSGILNTAAGALFLTGMSPLAGMAVQGANQALQSAVGREQLSAEEVESSVSLVARPLESLLGREKVEIKDEHSPGKVIAVAAGGAIGGATGAFVGPYAGVIAGYHLAGGLGGTIGMVAGGLGGFLLGSELGGRAGGFVADRIGGESFDAKTYVDNFMESQS